MSRTVTWRASIVVMLLVGGCAAEERAPRRRHARSDAVDGCDAERLTHIVRELGARTRGRAHFEDRVPVGAVRERVVRCEVGEPLSDCRARHEVPRRHLWLRARTERRMRMIAAQPRGRLENELARLAATDDLLQLGHTVQERHVVRAEVCAWTADTERVRVPRVTASGADPLELMRFAASADDVVVDIERDRFRLRCAARGEVVHRPEPREACRSL